MKKIICITLALLMSLICLVSCGATATYDMDMKTEAMEAPMEAGNSMNFGYADNYFAADEEVYVTGDSFEMEIVTTQTSKEESQSTTGGRKIIYSSDYQIHTKEYDASLAALEALCAKTGAYFENKNAYGGEDGRERRSNYTIRVPVENYKEFISSAGSIGTVVYSSENNRDITEQYYDSQARLESTLIREERVLEILKNASKLDDILALERELADIRYEIENLTGTLRKYDSLVSYCTITMEIRETSEAVRAPAAVLTFGERVSKGFLSGIENFVDGVQDFVVELSYNFIGIIFWLVVIIVIAIFVTVSVKKSKKKRVQKAPEEKKPEEENK